jgi:hypothetical protein
MATQAETLLYVLDAPDCQMALKRNCGFRRDNVGRKHNHALQTLANGEGLGGNAVESFATEVLRSALNRLHSRLSG